MTHLSYILMQMTLLASAETRSYSMINWKSSSTPIKEIMDMTKITRKITRITLNDNAYCNKC